MLQNEIPCDSQVPVFNASGDVLLFERMTQRLKGWSRGEVVVATSPKDPDARICRSVFSTKAPGISNQPSLIGGLKHAYTSSLLKGWQ